MDTSSIYDVVIVGSGISGSIIANQLGLAGKRVLILESGPGFQPGSSREGYLERFYTQLNKTPEAPYPAQVDAPRALTEDIFNYQRNQQGQLQLKPGFSSYLQQTGPDPFSSTYERQAGGTAWHWLGTCLRMLPNDFRLNSLYGCGMDWPLGYDDLASYYCQAEYLIGVAADVQEQAYLGITFPPEYVYPMQALPNSVVDQTLAAGVNGTVVEGRSLQVTTTPAGRNAPSNPRANNGKGYNNGRRLCAGNTACVPICPIQAKYDPTITLTNALQTGRVDILYKSVAVNVAIDTASGRVSGIEYVTYNGSDALVKNTAVGHIYVLAAHAIETPRLLLNSNRQLAGGVANSSGEVGCNLMDHPVMNAWALLPPDKPVYPFRGPNSTSGIESLRDGGFRRERGAFRIEFNNDGWGWPTNAPYSDVAEFVDQDRHFGQTLLQALYQRLTRQIDMNFLVEQLPLHDNRISLCSDQKDPLGIPLPRISYRLGTYVQESFVWARALSQQLFTLLNAQEFTNFAGQQSFPNYFSYAGQDFLFQGAGHIVGTYRMGKDRRTSVVDWTHRSWDHQNLFLVGSGVFPTIATSNPTLTIAALCLMAAERILGDLGQS